MRDNYIQMYRRMKGLVVRDGWFDSVDSGKAFDDMLDAVEMEWDHFPGTELTMFTICAQKPLLAT